MQNSIQPVMPVFMLFVSFLAPQLAAAQSPKAASDFQGRWEGGTYCKDKSHAPVGVNVNKDPCNRVSLDLTQEGKVLKGEYGASIGWGRRFEPGEFSTTLTGNVAKVQLESGWGGKVTVTLTLRGKKLYWKIIESVGENYFPDGITLHRTK